MIHRLAPLALMALAPALGVTAAGAPAEETPRSVTHLTFLQRIIIRIPKLHSAAPQPRMPIPVPPRWTEKKGPKCVAAHDLAGAMISRPGAIDLVLTGGERVRAVLDEDCGPLDYYGGYYLRPASDGQICGGRDPIRVRSGGSCMIARFRRLVAAR